MRANELYERVADRLPEDADLAPRQLTHVVLRALAERLSPEEAAELGAELPEELGDLLAGASGDGALQRDEFIESLASQLDVDDELAEQAAQAVLVSMRELLEPVLSIDQVLESLPPDLAQLMS
jgi:uncharacterized protein (DUF2267 family)